MKFLGNDPTGSYAGKFQGKPRHLPNKGKSIQAARKKFIAHLRELDAKEPISKPLPTLRVSHLPTKPNHSAWLASKASSDFWSKVKPKSTL